MGAIGHPDGLDCTRLPVTLPAPTGLPESWSSSEIEAGELHAGREWIDKAVAALRRAERPSGNRPRDRILEAVDYELSDPCRGATFVRMIDYTGELIHPDLEHDPESLANELKTRFRELDGLIVLADVSASGERGRILADDHRSLREALASLADAPDFERAAIVVVFTKWDRESQIQINDPDSEYARLDAFLAKHRAHKALVDTVRNVAGVGAASQESRRVIFPASAFGESILRDGDDHPAPEGSRPFGLLEPFLAMADLRDSIDAEKFEAEAVSWSPRRLRKLRERSRDVLLRMPVSAVATGRIRKARASALKRLGALVIGSLAILLSGTYELAGWTLNHRPFKALQWTVENPEIDGEQLNAARERLQRYYAGEWRRWLPMAPQSENVDSVRHQIDERYDQILWRPVETAASLAEKAKSAKRYIERLPLGTQMDEAKRIIRDDEQVRADQFIDSRFNDWEMTIQDANSDSSKILELLKELLSFSISDTDELRRDRRDKLIARCRERVAANNWDEILELLRSDDFKGAAEAWARLANDEEVWKVHARELLDKFKRTGKTKVQNYLQQDKFEEAERCLEMLNAALAAMEEPANRLDPALGKEVMTVKREVGPGGLQQDRIRLAKDRTKYKAIQETRSMESVRDYLDNFSDGVMQKAAREYFQYLIARANPKQIEIAVFLVWDRTYTDDEDDHVLSLSVDGRKVVVIKNLSAIPGDTTRELGRFTIPTRDLSSSHQFHVYLVEEDPLWEDAVGAGISTLKLSDLESEGKRIKLIPPSGEKFLNQALLKIVSGIPKKPELPPWKEPSSSR